MSEEQATETWRDIPGFPGYQASDLGRIRSFFKHGNISRIGDKSRILKQYRLPTGYLYVDPRRGGRNVHCYVHRLVLMAFRGEPPEGMESRHVNDNDRANNRLDNLCWGTRTENATDRIRHGTATRGSKNRQAKLTETRVILMRLLHATGVHSRDLAVLFDQSRANVQRIVNRQMWRHV